MCMWTYVDTFVLSYLKQPLKVFRKILHIFNKLSDVIQELR